MSTTDPRVVVIGVGNSYRGDDEAGLAVAQRLRARLHGVEVVESDGEPTRLLDAWTGARLAIVVDAVHSHDAPPGHVHRFDVGPEGLALTESLPSTHGMGPGDAIALGRALGRLPERLLIYGIEGDDFGEGAAITLQVARAIDEVVERVWREVMAARRDRGQVTP
jgi:hydrogenase maturation protease